MNAGVKALSEQARKLTPEERIELLERDSAGVIPRVNLSVKVTALTLLLRPHAPDRGRAALAARLRELLRRARDVGACSSLAIPGPRRSSSCAAASIRPARSSTTTFSPSSTSSVSDLRYRGRSSATTAAPSVPRLPNPEGGAPPANRKSGGHG